MRNLKVLESQAMDIIEEALEIAEKPCVAWSGGKDSTVVLYLVRQLKPDVIVVWNNTTNEFPETIRFVRSLAKEWNLNFHEIRPTMTFWEVMDKYGFPKPRFPGGTPKCCEYLKEKPSVDFYLKEGIDVIFDGLTTWESKVRRATLFSRGPIRVVKNIGRRNLKKTIIKASPIWNWRPEEVWAYIEKEGIPVNPAYKKYGIPRVGCMVCTAYVGWQRQLRSINPRLYEYVVKKMREKGEKVNVESGLEDWMEVVE